MPGLAALADWQKFPHRESPFLSSSLVVPNSITAPGDREFTAALTGIIVIGASNRGLGSDKRPERQPRRHLVATCAAGRGDKYSRLLADHGI
jgi:hypothetical protein